MHIKLYTDPERLRPYITSIQLEKAAARDIK